MLNPSGDGRRKRLDGFTPRSNRTPVVIATTEPAPTPRAGSRQVTQRSASPRRRRILVGALIAPLVLVAIAAGWIFWPRGSNQKLTALAVAASVVKSTVGAKTTLKGETTDRTTTVFYGMTKDGLRTDSIMLSSYYWKEKKLVTLNIPRDLQVYDGYETVKFGEVYAYAIARRPKDSAYPSQFVADLIAKEYGLNVDYWVKLNMQGEVSLIDTLGGIDITVPTTFTDYEYPTWNYSGYIRPAPHFTAGLTHMNGDTALIYSRSRHSLDAGEGTDFARSKRQMLVLASVITKVKTLGIVGNLTDISHYLTILGDNVDTNMSTDEMVAFAGATKSLDPDTDLVKGNWAVGNGYLCSSVSAVGGYIALYGVPSTSSCTVSAGGKSDSKYRELAIYYVNHMLASAPMTDTDFVTSALPNLPSPYGVGATTTANSGTSQTTNSAVLGDSTSQTP